MNAPFPLPLIDGFQRRVSYLRLSVTDRCDLRCAYCMPERQRFVPPAELLSLDELHRLARGFVARGVIRIRLTGGEPLMRPGVIGLIEALGREIGGGLDELTLTTNATRLAEFAPAIAAAGVQRVNVSLDTRDPAVFARLTRRARLPDVLAGIDAAKAAGLAVKINTVALRGVNEHEIPDLIAWAHAQGHAISLIETMPLGEVEADRTAQYLPLDEVRRALEARWTLAPSTHRTGGPARYFDIAETGGRLGLITPLTGNFCDGCNRVRVTATGMLHPCLGGEVGIDLSAALRAGGDLDAALDAAMRVKPARHNFAISAGAPALARHMSLTGG